MFTFVISSAMLKMVAYFGQKFFENDYAAQYNSTSMVVLEMICIVTSHGVTKFPIHLTVRVLVMSWTFFSLLIGTGYSTGYTSLLTIPRFTKPIDQLSDFIEQGITWGQPFKDPTFLTFLYATENPLYIELAKRVQVEKSSEAVYKKLEEGNYGKYTKSLDNGFVFGAESIMPLSKQLRVMTQCVFKYFSVFGFEKLSPFRKIFDRQIPRFFETGILDQWFRELNALYSDSRMKFFFDKGVQETAASPLKLESLEGVAYFLAIGLGLATMVFCGELIVFRLKIKKYKARELAYNDNRSRRIRNLNNRVREMKAFDQ